VTIRFDDRVVLVTGAGGGLGRAHALALAARGAKVVVNDLGAAAHAVADEITAAGGQALACVASVTDPAAVDAMVAHTMQRWGRVDVLVNNAGILRDKSFAKMSLEDFSLVMNVHLMGAVHCCKAVWDIMRTQNYGRIVMTTSSSGLWGNFGQSNYGAAKMALVGLMQTLALEGEKHNIRVNALAPTAATAMTAGLMPEPVLAQLSPEAVTPALLYLACDDAPTRAIVCAGAGSYETAQITLTQGVHLAAASRTVEEVATQFAAISDRDGSTVPASGTAQTLRELGKAQAVSGLGLE
jgi:NAD(P)-dependent dehydrogenase (short-subunit alcohol dehydrogenase family)